ncbi:MAG: ROK family protein [Gammaproteobacteria bacterium]
MGAIGIDLGGTKTEIIAVHDSGAELLRRRAPTPRQYPQTLQLLEELVVDADAVAGSGASVGIGIPGTISPLTGRIKNANSTWLIGHALDQDLSSRLQRPVTVMNDANCFALSEAVDGAGAGCGVVFGVILGTGVGGGIVVNGRILEGAQRIAGEWGHNPLPLPSAEELARPVCYCGRTACIEMFLSGPAMEQDHKSKTGETRNTREIVGDAVHGHPGAIATLARYVERLGRSLAGVVNILDPDVIVLGGGMSNLPGLAERTQAAMSGHLFTDQATTPVRKNLHGDASGVRGAAWLGANALAGQSSTASSS